MSSELPYRFESAANYSVLSLEPGLNEAQWNDIERVGSDVLAKVHQFRPPAMIIDLSALSYMGSAMVALIVRVWKAVRESDGKMVVVNRHPTTYEVLKLAGLVKVWTIVDSREAAYAHLNVKTTGNGAVVAARSGSQPSLLLIGIAVLALGASSAALASRLGASHLIDERAEPAVIFIGAALALMAGTVIGVKSTGVRRIIGVAVVLGSLAVIVAGVLSLPGGILAVPPAVEPAADAGTGD